MTKLLFTIYELPANYALPTNNRKIVSAVEGWSRTIPWTQIVLRFSELLFPPQLPE